MMETEEILESRLIAIVEKGVPDMFVIGMLTPFKSGEVKCAPDTHIAVSVDLASQDIDWRGLGVPCTYEARITVNSSMADDASGNGFRDTCRAVRAALNSCAGDGCYMLSGDGVMCDGIAFNSTSTAFSDGDTDAMTKTYSLTIYSRTTKEN